MSYGTELPKSEYRPIRDLIGTVEQTAAGNTVLRIGREDADNEGAWTQIGYVVLTPNEVAEFIQALTAASSGELGFVFGAYNT